MGENAGEGILYNHGLPRGQVRAPHFRTPLLSMVSFQELVKIHAYLL